MSGGVNSVGAAPRSRASRAEAYAAFDALPREVRAHLWESPPFCAVFVSDYLACLGGGERRSAIRRLLAELRRSEAAELELFAERMWPGPGPYPHLAAGASILRYHGNGTRA